MDGRQGWWVVFGAFLALVVNAGVSFFVIGALLESIILDTGWSLTQVSLAVTVWGLSAGVVSPLCGHLIDRFGARPVMLFGSVLTCISLLLIGQVQELWQLYVVMAIAPIGAMCNTFIAVAAVIARWFVRHRGVATGVALFGLGVGGAVFPAIANALLEENTWRDTYTIIALISLVSLIPTVLFVRNPRESEIAEAIESVQKSPEGTDDALVELLAEDDLTLSQALRTRSFWGVGLGDALTGLIFALFNIQLILFLTYDLESDDQATLVFGVFQICLGLGTLMFGPLTDLFHARTVMIVCYGLPAIALLALIPQSALVLALGFALLAGLPGGGRSAVFPVTLVYCFGERHLGAIWGVSNLLFMFGNALGPVIGGAIYERTGSTQAVYIFCIVTLAVSTVLVSLLRNERARAERSSPSEPTP